MQYCRCINRKLQLCYSILDVGKTGWGPLNKSSCRPNSLTYASQSPRVGKYDSAVSLRIRSDRIRTTSLKIRYSKSVEGKVVVTFSHWEWSTHCISHQRRQYIFIYASSIQAVLIFFGVFGSQIFVRRSPPIYSAIVTYPKSGEEGFVYFGPLPKFAAVVISSLEAIQALNRMGLIIFPVSLTVGLLLSFFISALFTTSYRVLVLTSLTDR